MQNKARDILTNYFSKLNAGLDVSDDVQVVVQTIFDTKNELKDRDLHLASVLYSNNIDPSVKFIINLVRTVLEIDGAYLKQITIPSKNGKNTVTVAGSGKKGVKTVNISTPAALVAASCGSQIVKPCSKSTSSLTGSSDFFTILGGRLCGAEESVEILKKTNLGLVSIESAIPQFDHLYGGKLLAPTSLSYALPAMVTPIRTDAVLYGLSLPDIKKSIHALHGLGYSHVMVANSSEDKTAYIDEIGLFKYNKVVFGRTSQEKSELLMADPVDLLRLNVRYNISQIREKQDKLENVKATLDVLKGVGEEVLQKVISVNASAMIYLSGGAEDIAEGYDLATKELSTGRPFEKLREVIELSGGTLNPQFNK